MNHQYIKKGMLIMLVLFSCMRAAAQPVNADQVTNDTSYLRTATPGRLFNVTTLTNTAAAGTVTSETLNRATVPNLYNTLSGRLPGLFAIQGNGTPGNDNPQLYIRGLGSYGLAYANSAKVFVDGFEVAPDFVSYLSASEIASVSILKDAAALATFGMKGANGVIWIETRRGNTGGKPTTTVQLRSGVQKPINVLRPLNAYNFASLYNQAVSNENGKWTPFYSESQLQAYQNGKAADVNWYDQVLKSEGRYSDADITFNGGSEKGRYNVVLGYADQQGLYNVKNTDQTSNQIMQRFNVRGNLDFNLFKVVEANIDLGARLENRKQPDYPSIMDDLARYPSNIYPVYDTLVKNEESNFSGTALYPNNPLGSIAGMGWSSSRARTLQSNFRFREKLDFIARGLYLQEGFSFYVRSVSTYSKARNYARYFNGVPTTTDQTTSIVASDYGTGGMDQHMQGSLSLGYENSFEKNVIHSALNFDISDLQSEGLFAYKQHYMNYSGRLNYAYDARYVGELGFSYFGSDAYASGNRFGFYPTLSAAWIVSNESFLKNNDKITLLKLRASAGTSAELNTNATDQTGFYSNGRYLYQQYYSWNTPFYTGVSAPFSEQSSMRPLFIANPKVFAEQSMKYNAGVDVELFHKFHLTADFFLDKRTDILTKKNSQMDYYGNNNYLDNIGKMTNKGFELSSSYAEKTGNLDYSLYGLVCYAKNTIDYMGEVAPAFAYNAYTGRSFGTQVGLVSQGFYQTEDFNADGNLKEGIATPLFGTVKPGDIRYKDIDGNGFVDQTDVTKIGSPAYPEWGYSFGAQAAYKGFDFSILFQGAAAASVNLLNYPAQFIAFVNNGNAYKGALNAWAYFPEQNIDTRATASYPRLTTQSNENNYRNSSFWIRENNYLRIKNVEVGYDLSKSVFKTAGISKCRIFLNSVNPVTFSKLLKNYNMDPESGYGYPALSSYYIGISMTF